MVITRATRFCEAVRSGIAQPANSWSSLIFFETVALFLLITTLRTRLFIQHSPLYSYIFIAIVALVGGASYWNHSTLGFWGGLTDFESMYLLITFIALLGLSWFRPMSKAYLIGTWLVINIPLTYIASQTARITDYSFMALVLLVIGLELSALWQLKRFWNGYFWLSLLSMATGYLIWQLDVRKIWCNPYSIWQGHAFWHLLTAIAAGLLYFYLVNKPDRQMTRSS